jgi:hypothetical protein
MHFIVLDVGIETAAFVALVRLTCTKRTVRLAKDAKRKSWSTTVADCTNGFLFFAEVTHKLYTLRLQSRITCLSMHNVQNSENQYL